MIGASAQSHRELWAPFRNAEQHPGSCRLCAPARSGLGYCGTPKNPPKTVLRAGFGMFYDRFGYDLVAQQQRLNGHIQQQFS